MKRNFRMGHAGLTTEHGTFGAYGIGFILSLLLTLTSYILVVGELLSKRALIATIVGLGILQMIIQLLFFLHLNTEPKPRWNLISFLFMVLVVFCLVGGSLWIMYNLDDRVMAMPNLDLHHQSGF